VYLLVSPKSTEGKLSLVKNMVDSLTLGVVRATFPTAVLNSQKFQMTHLQERKNRKIILLSGHFLTYFPVMFLPHHHPWSARAQVLQGKFLCGC